MTPNELAAALREHNAWRRGEGKYGNELAPETMPFSPPQLGEILDQAADALEACAQQAEVWAEWQPIETAPRDGKVFLSFGPKGIHPTYWGCVHGGEAIQQAMEARHRETWDMAMDAALNEIERARCDGESDMRQVRNWIRVLTCPPLKKEKPE